MLLPFDGTNVQFIECIAFINFDKSDVMHSW